MTQNSSDELHLVTCLIGDEEYCLDTKAIAGICRAEMLTQPAQAAGSLGTVPWNRVRVPVYDLAARLRREFDSRPPLEFVLVLATPRQAATDLPYWGLGIDGVSRLIEPSRDRLHPFPSGAAPGTDLYKGVIRWDDRLIPYVHSDRLHPAMPAPEVPNPAPAAGRRAPATASPSTRILGYGLPNPVPEATKVLIGLAYKQVVKLIDRPRVVPVAYAPAHIAGLVEWEQVPVPVVDFGHAIGCPRVSLDTCDRMLILHGGAEMRYLSVPFANDLIQVPISTWAPAAESPYPRRFVRGVYRNKEMTLVIPDFSFLQDLSAAH